MPRPNLYIRLGLALASTIWLAFALSLPTSSSWAQAGSIFRFTGAPCGGGGNPCPGWQQLDANSVTVGIAAGGNNLYQLHNDGSIFKFTGAPCGGGGGNPCPGWCYRDDMTLLA
jgi:hypothetical protein